MDEKKEEKINITKIIEIFSDDYVGEEILKKISIPKKELEKTVQDMYHTNMCKSSWYGIDPNAVSKLYNKTKIKPEYSSKELKEIDKKMANAVAHTTGFGIGHEDAGHYEDYKLIKNIIPLEALPKFKETVEHCYEKSVGFCSLDLLCLYKATEIKPDFDMIAQKKGIKKQKIIDNLYKDADELSSRWKVSPKLVYEMSGILPSSRIQDKFVKKYLGDKK